MFSFGFMSHHLLRFNGAVKVACLLFKPYVFCSLNSGLPLLWAVSIIHKPWCNKLETDNPHAIYTSFEMSKY